MAQQKSTGNTRLVKNLNKQEILLQCMAQEQISRADLSKITKLSRPCVSSLVVELIETGFLKEVGIGNSKGGRKPILLEYNYQAYVLVGAVLDGHHLHMVLADLRGSFIKRFQMAIKPDADTQETFKALERGVQELLQESGYDREHLLGVGIGLPGIAQRRDGTVSFSPVTGWAGLPIQQELEQRLGVPVMIDNDVNMMTLAEYSRGVGAGYGSVVYMYVGTGIGSGIILDGQMFRGSKEAAGEVGCMMIGPIPAVREKDTGVFEQNFSLYGIKQRARELLSDHQEGESLIEHLTKLASNGSKEAEQLLEETYKHWTFGMVNLISVLNPELLILSGEMIHIDEKGVSQIKGWLQEWVPVVPEIEKASLGDQAGLVGAVQSVLEAFPLDRLLQQ
uniref:ROK family protein n=2 Tax=Brevibacillus daliensis TaxID=2892995 RepID=UPI001E38634A